METLNYHHLLNFWLVAREGSVQKASQVLHVTPASVSIQVRQLEKALGVKLLQKQGRGVTVTDIGRQVAEYAEEIFSTGNELLQLVRGRPLGKPLELRVGVREVMPKLVAYQLLAPAMQLEQRVRLKCIEGNMDELVSDLAIHKLDVVLSDTPLNPLYKIQAHSHRLGESQIIVVGTELLAQRYSHDFPASLEGAPFVLPTSDNLLRRQMDRWFDDHKITPDIRGEFADSAMMKIAAKHGLGLVVTPKLIQSEVEQMYGLTELGQVNEVREQFYAVSVDRKVKHPAVIAIRDAAAKAAQTE